VNAVDAAEDVLLTATVDIGTQTNPRLLGVLQDGRTFAEIAREGTAADPGPGSILTLRAIGLDDNEQALFQQRIGSTEDPASGINTLRYGTRPSVEIAREGAALTPGDLTLLTFAEARINHSGDVAFIAQLGVIEPDTSRIEEIRAVVRHPDGTFKSVASSKNQTDVGPLTDLSIAGFDDSGNVLLIGSRTRSNDRVLILAPSND
jgi:hypothetical protein